MVERNRAVPGHLVPVRRMYPDGIFVRAPSFARSQATRARRRAVRSGLGPGRALHLPGVDPGGDCQAGSKHHQCPKVKAKNYMRIITAKYPGTCRSCGESIVKGEQIAFLGKGHAEHFECFQQGSSVARRSMEDARAGLEPGTLANDRRLAKQGLSVVRFSSGAVVTRNARGRCEDAPCCGCCS